MQDGRRINLLPTGQHGEQPLVCTIINVDVAISHATVQLALDIHVPWRNLAFLVSKVDGTRTARRDRASATKGLQKSKRFVEALHDVCILSSVTQLRQKPDGHLHWRGERDFAGFRRSDDRLFRCSSFGCERRSRELRLQISDTLGEQLVFMG